MIKYSGVNEESVVDGEGVRVTIYFNGCPHKCEACHNPETHDRKQGMDFNAEVKDKILQLFEDKPYLSGLTLSGGDPVYLTRTSQTITDFIVMFKKMYPNKTIWCYTGYRYEDLMKYQEENGNIKRFLNEIDVLIDGRFELKLFKPDLLFRGSTNQRIIDMKNSTSEEVKLFMED